MGGTALAIASHLPLVTFPICVGIVCFQFPSALMNCLLTGLQLRGVAATLACISRYENFCVEFNCEFGYSTSVTTAGQGEIERGLRV